MKNDIFMGPVYHYPAIQKESFWKQIENESWILAARFFVTIVLPSMAFRNPKIILDFAPTTEEERQSWLCFSLVNQNRPTLCIYPNIYPYLQVSSKDFKTDLKLGQNPWGRLILLHKGNPELGCTGPLCCSNEQITIFLRVLHQMFVSLSFATYFWKLKIIKDALWRINKVGKAS